MIPQEFQAALTMNGSIPVSYTEQPVKTAAAPFSSEQVDQYISMAKAGRAQSMTDSYLFQALAKFPLKGKNVAVLGSTSPWYESILLAHGAIPTTIAPIENLDPRLKNAGAPFDAALSFFQLRSLGLGSDINPNADLDEMKRAKQLVKPGSLFFLSIPVGKDRLVWNSHRVYGEARLKALFKGWRPAGYFGYSYEDLLKDPPRPHEPVMVLKAL